MLGGDSPAVYSRPGQVTSPSLCLGFPLPHFMVSLEVPCCTGWELACCICAVPGAGRPLFQLQPPRATLCCPRGCVRTTPCARQLIAAVQGASLLLLSRSPAAAARGWGECRLLSLGGHEPCLLLIPRSGLYKHSAENSLGPTKPACTEIIKSKLAMASFIDS